MTHLHTEESEAFREYDDERYEEQSASGRGQDVGAPRLTAGLRHHIACHDESVDRIGGELPYQCSASDADDVRIIAEDPYNSVRKRYAHDAAGYKKGCTDLDSEPICAFQPSVQSRSVAETAEWLEALAPVRRQPT